MEVRASPTPGVVGWNGSTGTVRSESTGTVRNGGAGTVRNGGARLAHARRSASPKARLGPVFSVAAGLFEGLLNGLELRRDGPRAGRAKELRPCEWDSHAGQMESPPFAEGLYTQHSPPTKRGVSPVV